MAEEFQAEVCGGGWWRSPRTTFNPSSYIGNYGGCWQNDHHLMTIKPWSTEDSSNNQDSSIIFQKSGGGAAAISPDSAFQMMGTSPPSTTTNWNQALLV